MLTGVFFFARLPLTGGPAECGSGDTDRACACTCCFRLNCPGSAGFTPGYCSRPFIRADSPSRALPSSADAPLPEDALPASARGHWGFHKQPPSLLTRKRRGRKASRSEHIRGEPQTSNEQVRTCYGDLSSGRAAPRTVLYCRTSVHETHELLGHAERDFLEATWRRSRFAQAQYVSHITKRTHKTADCHG